MSNERDPLLESLFTEAASSQTLATSGGDFIDGVVKSIEARRRNVLLGRIGIVALIVLFELVLSSPLQNSVGVFTTALSTSLIDLNNGWVAVLVEPINSVAGIIGILLLGMHTLYRRVIH